jgi:metal-responsive CopG/Arc/MetJ family transcriptional regulator
MEDSMEKTTDIHIVLPTDLVARLDQLAEEMDLRRTELLRRVLIQFLNHKEQERIEQQMASYVTEMAPHSGEFVKESEKHTIRRLLRETKW